MSLYSVKDLSETLLRLRIKKDEVKRVLYAWGNTWGPNSISASEPYNFIQGDTDWEGGFILELQDETVICITGKCDYSGWGCVDNITLSLVKGVSSNYSWEKLKKSFKINERVNADNDPIDLNRWINNEIELDQTTLNHE